MNRKERSRIITEIADRLQVSGSDVENVINLYEEAVSLTLQSEIHPDLRYGIVGFEDIPLCPGITLIYGWESTGKSALAKRIARSLSESGENVLFVEADSKRSVRDHLIMPTVFHTEDTSGEAIHRFLTHRLIDVVIIDSLTALLPNAQRYLLHHAKKTSPYVIGVTQMRYQANREKVIPAVSDLVQSMASTHIYMNDALPLSIDGITSVVTTATFMKHPDPRVVKQVRPVVIIGEVIHNGLTAFHRLQSEGRIESMGLVKYVDKQRIGHIHSLVTDPAVSREILNMLHMGEGEDVFYSSDPVYEVPSTGMFRGAGYTTSVRL